MSTKLSTVSNKEIDTKSPSLYFDKRGCIVVNHENIKPSPYLKDGEESQIQCDGKITTVTNKSATTRKMTIAERVKEEIEEAVDFIRYDIFTLDLQEIWEIIQDGAMTVFDNIAPNATKRGQFKTALKLRAKENPEYEKQDIKLANYRINLGQIEKKSLDETIKASSSNTDTTDLSDRLIRETAETINDIKADYQIIR
ncbi:MAG: hypothetical protein LBG88_04125 [Christensenellaceae bacterium]|nr:hypothetical protein [Christensenellaceae bacterium]